MIRANETMYKAGQVERVILRKLSEADPEGKRHCIRMLGSFEYRHHLCLVFEAMARMPGGAGGGGCWGLVAGCWALAAGAARAAAGPAARRELLPRAPAHLPAPGLPPPPGART